MATVEEIARAYWTAEESRVVSAIMAHFHPDAVWDGPGLRLVGAEEISRFYRDSGAAFPGLEVTVGRVFGDVFEAAIEWRAVLIDPSGGRHPLRGMNVMRADGERITSLCAYFDRMEVNLGVDESAVGSAAGTGTQ